MGNVNYKQWITGKDCCKNNCDGDCNCHNDVCDCENILLEISKLHTDDEILQDEIDELSGKVEAVSADVDTKLDASAYTPVDLTDYATKEWVNDKGYLTTVEPLKTINGESLIGEGNIVISGGSGGTVDAYTKAESDARFQPIGDYLSGNALNGYATEDWVRSQGYLTEHQPLSGYVTNATFLQYVTNLQEQINSLISSISGCCGETGETTYRWVIETGENDYWCSGTTKMSKEKQQSSTDGINWTDTGVERSGSTVLEENCVECGYVPALTGKKYTGVTTANTEGSYDCNCDEDYDDPACKELIAHELTYVFNPTGVGKMKSVTVGDCVEVIGIGCFVNETNLETVILPPTITAIKYILFKGCASLQNLTLLGTTPPIFSGSAGLKGLFSPDEVPPANFRIYVPASAVNTYKAATEWSNYSSIIVGI